MQKTLIAASVLALAGVAVPTSAYASPVTWNYNWQISPASTLINPGFYGSITLSDPDGVSANQLDVKRVNIDIDITAAHVGAIPANYLEYFFLNWSGTAPSLPKWFLVPQDNAVADTTPSAGSWIVNYDLKQVLNTSFKFDFQSGPTGTASLQFHGSIMLFYDNTNAANQVDLDVADFIATSVGGSAPLYSAFVANFTGVTNTGFGATVPVPEPTSMVLLSTGLLTAVAFVRRRRA